MDKVVVLGGSGFIGSHIADCLSDRGYQVTIFDRTESSYLRPDQNMVIGDILDTDLLGRTIKGAEFVYNFAGLTDLNQALDNPVKTIEVNIQVLIPLFFELFKYKNPSNKLIIKD